MTQDKFKISSAVISDKGLSDKRPQNEDSYLLLADSGLFAVADGVGGAQAGDVASEMAVEVLGEAFINLSDGEDAEDRMRAAIEKANAAIYQMSRDLAQLSTMATTLVALHIRGNVATIGHVGDSRLYRLDPTGVLFRETQDHSVVAEEVRAGRMSAEEAESHPSRNVISRALGAEAAVEIDMKTIMFEPGTTFLVCSDGVTRHIPDGEIRDLLFMEDNATEACKIIKRRCYDRGAEDNLTAVVINVVAAVNAADDLSLLELAPEETETVATARVGASSGQLFPDIAEPASGSPPLVDDSFELDVIEDLESTEEIEIPAVEEVPVAKTYTAPKPEEKDLVEIVDSPIDARHELKSRKDVAAYRADDFAGAEFIGKLLTGLVWLAVGILVGALGYFMISSTFGGSQNAADQLSQGSLRFEQLRREVDADPAKYLAKFSTMENKVAGDHYLVGRAYLLQSNYGAAKTSFENARNQLANEDESNRAILVNDIAAGLAIANSREAQDSFNGQSSGGEADAAELKPKGD